MAHERNTSIERLTGDDRDLIRAATTAIEPQYNPGKTRTSRTVGAARPLPDRTRRGSASPFEGVNPRPSPEM